MRLHFRTENWIPLFLKMLESMIPNSVQRQTWIDMRSPPQGGLEVMVVSLKVNGTVHSVTADLDTPLLYVLRNDLELNGAKFGCGLGQCGACTVLIDGAAARSCVMPIGALTQSEIVTLEGLGTLEQPHPLQSAFIEEQAAQCGYCIAGMITMAKAILDRNPHPSEAEVRLGLSGNLCRCGTHNRIVRAILKAAQAMRRS
jgi:nicotinate dehydrogenase subunit A